MSDSKLKTHIKRFYRNQMEPKGYVLKKARLPERFLDGLRQGIEFQPGSGHLAGQFTLNIFWSFTHPLDDGSSMSGAWRIGQILGQGDTWYPCEGDVLNAGFSAVSTALVNSALPFLDAYSTIQKIVEDTNSGKLDSGKAFGLDPGWNSFNQGYCHRFLGNRQEAIKHFQDVVEKHSDRPYDWVAQRRGASLAELQGLGA